MKTLYLSDLDGTLLNSSAEISDYSAKIINQFIKDGGCFSYATARSFVTASKVTAKLNVQVPVICYNGGFIIDNPTGDILTSVFFTKDEVNFISSTLNFHNVHPVVFAYVDGVERFSYIMETVTYAMEHFIDSRAGDPRHRVVDDEQELYTGDVFYIDCMGSESSLSPVNSAFSDNGKFNCIFHKDIYSKESWCEIMPANVSKANAAIQLRDKLGCERIVAFGDAINDLPLFSVADEKYAVSNAVTKLKEVATEVIDSNDNDGVARWLSKNLDG